ncbi:hypothetical protein FPRO04_13261 [Fusarium proliferatum]|nr:hypothetical protein FPRO04_13261 [Fusarium proliferatum]
MKFANVVPDPSARPGPAKIFKEKPKFHSTEYKVFTDREGKARTDVAYGYSHRPKRKRDEFPLPKFPDQIESRITTAQARAFLNELRADTSHFNERINTFSGKGAAALLGPYALHPGKVKFGKRNREYDRYYIHVGDKYSTTTVHIEDKLVQALAERSINICARGQRIWLIIPAEHRDALEALVRRLVGLNEGDEVCDQFVRHLSLVITPALLEANDIEYKIQIQREGDWIVTEPNEYHMAACTTPSISFSMNFNLPSEEEAYLDGDISSPSQNFCIECGGHKEANRDQKCDHVRDVLDRKLRKPRPTNELKRTHQGSGTMQPAKKVKLSTQTRSARVADTDLENLGLTDINEPRDGEDLTDIDSHHTETPLGDTG